MIYVDRYAGLDVKVIDGYAKGYGHSPENTISYKYEVDHSWNAVKIKNKWHFIECTWGAGYIDDQKCFQKRYSDFYFLTDPKHLINDHFPVVRSNKEESKFWQLLDQPFTIEEYSRAVELSQQAMEWGLKFSHNDGVIQVAKGIEIEIEDPFNKLADVSMDFTSDGGYQYNKYVFLRQEKQGLFKLTVKPPSIGKYFLRIYGKVDKNKEDLDQFVEYIFQCTSVQSRIQPYPANDGLWGVKPKAFDIGIDPSAAESIVYKAVNGILDLKVKIVRPVQAMLHLTSAGNDENLQQFSLIETHDTYLRIKLRLPTPDHYKLEILCQTSESELFFPQIAYLIENSYIPQKSVHPFPKTYPQTAEFQCELIKPLDGTLRANTTTMVRFKSPKVIKALVGGQEMKQINGIWEAKIKTPFAGGKFEISGNNTDENFYWDLYQYTII